ncbi:MAG TPA: SGNH/GDSL hydrolase family protein [Hyphomonadaceae bacterium]|nr:SGNH/GDSL hydrolase family protein [Hyphomonadaceae bacterium]
MKRLALILAAAFALAGCETMGAAPPGAGWIGAWGASPSPPPANAKSFEYQTVRQVVRLSAAGAKVRIRFTNEYGDQPLVIGGASVAKAASPTGGPSGSVIPLTFNGAKEVTIPPKSPMFSDPVDLNVAALDSISISVFLPKATGPCTCHPQGTATAWVSAPGDFTAAGSFEPTSTFLNRAYISEVEVMPASPRLVVVTFGDSITDGTRSTNDANARWPDVLAQRLNAANGPAVVNAAISGNRVLSYGNAIFGEAALSRLDRDVFSVPGVRWMTVLEGINDLGMGRGPGQPTPEMLINGYKQIIARAHAHGIKVYGVTLMPYNGAAYYDEPGEATREKVNDWIRTGGGFDGVIDFDKLMQDPANPKKLKADLQSGDWLHPNDAGYKVMGEAVDLALFK